MLLLAVYIEEQRTARRAVVSLRPGNLLPANLLSLVVLCFASANLFSLEFTRLSTTRS